MMRDYERVKSMSQVDEHNRSAERPLMAVERRAAIVEQLRRRGAVTVAELEEQFGISSMTARRDLSAIEQEGVARRTHGGAVLPSLAGQEDSFASRLAMNVDAKVALAAAAAEMVKPGESVLIDCSTTGYHVVRALIKRRIPCTVITNSQPAMELIAGAEIPSLELIAVGGTLRPVSRSYVGPFAVHTVLGHFADRLFFSVKGISSDGVLTDADVLEAEVKRAMISRAAESILLVDQSKLVTRGFSMVGPISALSAVLVTAVAESELAFLRAPGVRVQVIGAT
jgi:DeoR/GlpR family transcriptional regulator of sugar metabolism